MAKTQHESRVERDPLGQKEVPAEAYYGIQTLRAVENFPISGLRLHPAMVNSTLLVKKAAALANIATHRLDERIGKAIVQAADEVLETGLLDQFVVDVFQAGAGTSHNMNVNEVIANRAIEVLGGRKGDYTVVHPNDHVNMAQSTNDVFPTAMRLAALTLVAELSANLRCLEEAFRKKSREFNDVIKPGRTHLQDAVPMTLGQEMGGYADSILRADQRIAQAADYLTELNIGATAVGTGLNAEPSYSRRVVEELRFLTGFNLREGQNLVQLTQSMADFVALSGALKALAVDLSKIASDLRLLSSGPRTGIAEIGLPAVQPGSSIMPGKVNPVMPEMLNMVCFQVIGCDCAVTVASEAGQLELNVMMPVIAFNLHFSLEILSNAVRAFEERCVRGITANKERCLELAERSLGVATALSPYLGYEVAASLAKEALATGRSIREVVLEKRLLTEEK
ncbi:MAG: aspartate ammonia-lyase, partial [Chloroflexi bacterium]|nr:aspartate ammonia-lyase [Chloroflexota bacterium]